MARAPGAVGCGRRGPDGRAGRLGYGRPPTRRQPGGMPARARRPARSDPRRDPIRPSRRPCRAAAVLLLLVALPLGAALGGCGRSRWALATSPAERASWPRAPAARVGRVVDGDTLEVAVAGRRERVRLIGVDTPETVAPGRPVEPYGPQASAFAKHWLTGATLRLAADAEPRDHYGRLLAYAWLGDGTFWNALLLAEGYARPLTIRPNDAFAELFARLAATARSAHHGLWARAAATAPALGYPASSGRAAPARRLAPGGGTPGGGNGSRKVKASGPGPWRCRCARRSLASSMVGSVPAGSHHRVRYASARRWNHSRRRRMTSRWRLEYTKSRSASSDSQTERLTISRSSSKGRICVAFPLSVCSRQTKPGLWSASRLIGSSSAMKSASSVLSTGALGSAMFTWARWWAVRSGMAGSFSRV